MLSFSLHLSPLPALLHWSSRLVCRSPPCRLRWGQRSAAPPVLGAAQGSQTPPLLPSGLHRGRGVRSPRLLQEREGSVRSRRGSPGLPSSRRSPSAQPALGTDRGPRGYPQVPSASGGGEEGGAAGGSAPSPSRLQGHFVFPPKDKGQ